MYMKAAVLEELYAPLTFMDLEIPELERGQVLVQVVKSGICGAQIGEIAGTNGPDRYLPHLMGHEGGGVVLKIGSEVTYVKVGDHVVMHWRKGTGIESDPPKYVTQTGLPVGGGWVTTFNEMAVVSENRLTAIDLNIPFEIAALMGCAVTTGLGIVYNDAQLQPYQSIMVAGCGGVGLNVIQGANLIGCSSITAVDMHACKLAMAKGFGATDFVFDIFSLARSGSNLDVFVDCTGDVGVIAYGYAMAKKTILVGQPKAGECLTLPNMRSNYCGKILMDSQGGQTNPTEDIPRYLRMYMDGLLDLDGLITDRFPLSEVNAALGLVRYGKSGRVILEMG